MVYRKYRAKKTVVDGITFDSKKEADFYCELKMLRMGGVVKDFECQHKFVLQEGFRHHGKAERAVTYTADFVIEYSDGHIEVVDVKGMRTDVYKLKRKLLLYRHPDMIFREV